MNVATDQAVELNAMNIPPSPHLSISSTRLGGSSVASAADDLIGPNAAEIQVLPPVDRGRDAWLFLAAAFTIETLVSGLPSSVVGTHFPILEGFSQLIVVCRASFTSTGQPYYFSMQTNRFSQWLQLYRWIRPPFLRSALPLTDL